MERARVMNLLKRWQSQLKKFKEERTYILPTKLGWSYSILCALLLFLAFVYNNNVTYFSCFALVSLGITSIFQTNYNMDRIKINLLNFPDTHAENPTLLKYLVTNESNQPSYDLKFHFDPKFFMTKKQENALHFIKFVYFVPYLGPKTSTEIEFSLVFHSRGYHTTSTLIAETSFPFGLLKSWKLKKPIEKVLIYPSKKGPLPLPTTNSLNTGEQISRMNSLSHGFDFNGHRPYQTNDSLRQIDWKAYARTNKLNIKLFENEEQGSQLITWEQTHSISNFENRISQITLWVSVCLKQRNYFILKMPNRTFNSRSSHFSPAECYSYLSTVQAQDFFLHSKKEDSNNHNNNIQHSKSLTGKNK